jgi:hypothetical protein
VSADSVRCPGCGAQLASDQRYCVSCGQRRGKARFPVAAIAAPAAAPAGLPVRTTAHQPAPPRLTSGSTLIAGIGTQLLAMGVGVLIGRESTPPARTNASAPVQVVTVGGGGASNAAAGTAGNATATRGKAVTASQGKGKPPIFKKVVVTKQALTKANNNLSQVVPTQNLAPPTVTTPGQSCSGGAGCQGGKFTGNFFGQ